jgi:hypothetical protein
LFREAATKYLEEETKKSLHNDAQALRALDPFIGDLYLEQVHSGTLEPFVKYMRGKSRKAGTINRYIAVVRRILNLAARYWRDADRRRRCSGSRKVRSANPIRSAGRNNACCCRSSRPIWPGWHCS